jgi:hypothetical protein
MLGQEILKKFVGTKTQPHTQTKDDGGKKTSGFIFEFK